MGRGGKSPRLDSDKSPVLNAQHPPFLRGHKASHSTSFYQGQVLGSYVKSQDKALGKDWGEGGGREAVGWWGREERGH